MLDHQQPQITGSGLAYFGKNLQGSSLLYHVSIDLSLVMLTGVQQQISLHCAIVPYLVFTFPVV